MVLLTERNIKLLVAARKGLVEEVRYLLNDGADISFQSVNGESALSLASEHGHVGVAKELIKFGVNVNQSTMYGETPLLKASRTGYIDVIKLLIISGADVNSEITKMFIEGCDDKHVCNSSTHTKENSTEPDIPSFNKASNAENVDDVIQELILLPLTMIKFSKQLSLMKMDKNLYVNGCTNDALSSEQGDNDKTSTEMIDSSHVGECFASTKNTTSKNKMHVEGPKEGIEANSSSSDTLELSNGGNRSIGEEDKQTRYAGLGTNSSGTLVDCLVENNNRRRIGISSLGVAAVFGHLEIVDYLLRHGANIEHKDMHGWTPLMLAANSGHTKVVKLLLENNADTSATCNQLFDNALSLACINGHEKVVEILIRGKANIESRNKSHFSPLAFAASFDHVRVVELLLQHGADVDSKAGKVHTVTPLLLAAINGCTSSVRLLLQRGSNIESSFSTNKCSVLSFACAAGHLEVIQLLLDHTNHLEHRSAMGLTPLMEVASSGNVEVAKILIKKGANVNALEMFSPRNSVLALAAKKGHQQFVELLIKNGAGATRDNKNRSGCTPMWLASDGGHLDVVKVLYTHSADVYVRDKKEVSILMAAFQNGHVKVVEWFVNILHQLPSQFEMSRYMEKIKKVNTDLYKKCIESAVYIDEARKKRDLEARCNEKKLLEESHTEIRSEYGAALKKRDKKIRRKQKKQQCLGLHHEESDSTIPCKEKDADMNIDEKNDTVMVNITSSYNPRNQVGEQSLPFKNQKSVCLTNTSVATTQPIPGSNLFDQSCLKKEKKKSRSRKRLAQLTLEVPCKTLEENTKLEIKVSPLVKRNEHCEAMKDIKDNSPLGANTLLHYSKSETVADLDDYNLSAICNRPAKELDGEPKRRILSNSLLKLSRLECLSSNNKQRKPKNEGYASNIQFGAPTKYKVVDLRHDELMIEPAERDDEKEWQMVTRRHCSSSSYSAKISVDSSKIWRKISRRGGQTRNAVRLEAKGAHTALTKDKTGQFQKETTVKIKRCRDVTKKAHNLANGVVLGSALAVKHFLPSNHSTSHLSAFTSVSANKPVYMPPGLEHYYKIQTGNSFPITDSLSIDNCSQQQQWKRGAKMKKPSVTSSSRVVGERVQNIVPLSVDAAIAVTRGSSTAMPLKCNDNDATLEMVEVASVLKSGTRTSDTADVRQLQVHNRKSYKAAVTGAEVERAPRYESGMSPPPLNNTSLPQQQLLIKEEEKTTSRFDLLDILTYQFERTMAVQITNKDLYMSNSLSEILDESVAVPGICLSKEGVLTTNSEYNRQKSTAKPIGFERPLLGHMAGNIMVSNANTVGQKQFFPNMSMPLSSSSTVPSSNFIGSNYERLKRMQPSTGPKLECGLVLDESPWFGSEYMSSSVRTGCSVSSSFLHMDRNGPTMVLTPQQMHKDEEGQHHLGQREILDFINL